MFTIFNYSMCVGHFIMAKLEKSPETNMILAMAVTATQHVHLYRSSAVRKHYDKMALYKNKVGFIVLLYNKIYFLLLFFIYL